MKSLYRSKYPGDICFAMWIISCDIVRSMEFESDFVFRGFITSKQVSNSP